jgi:hypothetical protein
MYWFKSKSGSGPVLIWGVVLSLFWSACKPDIKNNGAFDLKGYLKNDTSRLNKLNLSVFKTVTHNNITESKKVHIDNWGRELGLFADADINKPAWKNSYTVIKEDSLLVYKSKDKDLKVQELIIKLDKQKVKYILIYNKTENALYKTTQKLTYFPDSVYEIETLQHVKLMGSNFYHIKGVIIK